MNRTQRRAALRNMKKTVVAPIRNRYEKRWTKVKENPELGGARYPHSPSYLQYRTGCAMHVEQKASEARVAEYVSIRESLRTLEADLDRELFDEINAHESTLWDQLTHEEQSEATDRLSDAT